MDKLQIDSDHYLSCTYNDKQRFISYWHQVQGILELKPEKVLEIGIGSGLVSYYLRLIGNEIVTMDIDARLNPDIVGSVLDIPTQNESFDTVACFEVLEHLPYSSFHTALSELHRVSSEHVILSLPDANWSFGYSFHIPRLGERSWMVSAPRLRNRRHHFDGEHYWEIGKKGYSLKKVKYDMRCAGLIVENTYRIFEQPYHRFFVLRPMP